MRSSLLWDEVSRVFRPFRGLIFECTSYTQNQENGQAEVYFCWALAPFLLPPTSRCPRPTSPRPQTHCLQYFLPPFLFFIVRSLDPIHAVNNMPQDGEKSFPPPAHPLYIPDPFPASLIQNYQLCPCDTCLCLKQCVFTFSPRCLQTVATLLCVNGRERKEISWWGVRYRRPAVVMRAFRVSNLIIIIIKVFVKCKILSIGTVLSARAFWLYKA